MKVALEQATLFGHGGLGGEAEEGGGGGAWMGGRGLCGCSGGGRGGCGGGGGKLEDRGADVHGGFREETAGGGLDKCVKLEVLQDELAQGLEGGGVEPVAGRHESKAALGLEPEAAAINKSGKSVSLKVGKIVFKVVFEGLVHKGGAEVGRVGDDKVVVVGQQLVDGEIGREVGGERRGKGLGGGGGWLSEGGSRGRVGGGEILGEGGEVGGGGEQKGAKVLTERKVVKESMGLVLEGGGGWRVQQAAWEYGEVRETVAAPGLGDGAMKDGGVGEPRAQEDGEGGEGGGAGVKVKTIEVVTEDQLWDVLGGKTGGAIDLLQHGEGVNEDVSATTTGVKDFDGGGVGWWSGVEG